MVTGIGVILPNCDNREELWRHLRDGQSQLSLEAEENHPDSVYAVGRVRSFDPRKYLSELPEHLYTRLHREQQFYLSSVLQARDDARLDLRSVAAERIGLFDGTSRGNFLFWYERLRAEFENRQSEYTQRDLILGMPGMAVGLAAALLKIRGPTYTFNGTCAAGAIALGHAWRELQSGAIDVAFATGHDVALAPPLMSMYRAVQLLSPEREDPARAIRPYGGESTNAFGEGAVTLALETRAHAEQRGASPIAWLDGYRYGNGGAHPTHVDTTGELPARLIACLLAERGMTPDQICFVVGHGNGVKMSDLSELNYMKRVFGDRTREVPLLSTKPIYGHVLGASSMLSAAGAALMIHHGVIISTLNIDDSRATPGFLHRPPADGNHPCNAGLVVSFGIGGQNAVLLLRRFEDTDPKRTRP